MKLLKDIPLKRLALYVLGLMFLIFSAEYFLIRYKMEDLEEAEEKRDYARSIQLEGQQVASLVQLQLTGEQDLSARILAHFTRIDHAMKVLADGGRLEGSETFLKPLGKLPRITFDQLQEHWLQYKQTVLEAMGKASGSFSDPTARNIRADVRISSRWMTVSEWFNKLEIDLREESERKKSAAENFIVFIILFNFLLLGCGAGFFYLFVIHPVKKLKRAVRKRYQEKSFWKNEIGELAEEVNAVLEQLKDATDFVGALFEGKLDFDYKSLDNDYTTGKNALADSLIALQVKLQDLNEEERRRQWANEGLSQFVDILRSSNDNIHTLGDKIIAALVRYTHSRQGGLYTLNDDDPNNKFLELISLFAFDKKKYQKQKILLGEGLVGQAFLERETTLLKEIPDEYMRITSGLGDANPDTILIVPLKVDQEVYGVVELASFNEYKPHEIAFVEKLAETIASTLASVKTAHKNRSLIEQFQQQTEEMRAQEEEMRQNMEELQATQEELARKEADYVNRIQQLEDEVRSLTASLQETERLRKTWEHREKELQERIKILEAQPAQAVRADDWALAEDLSKTLQIQLEALRITEEELHRKKNGN